LIVWMGLCVLLKVFPWSCSSAAGGPSWTILAPRASCALLNEGGDGRIGSGVWLFWAVALLVAVNQLPVSRLGRILRVSTGADVVCGLRSESPRLRRDSFIKGCSL